MAKKKNNFFVVWVGNKPGIYNSWKECQAQINGFPNAKYKGFIKYETAKKALQEGPDNYWGVDFFETTLNEDQLKRIGQPIKNSIVVDAACSSNDNMLEYRGIYLLTGEQVFLKGPYKDGTNNIGEFLAIVHGLAYLKKQNLTIPVYSDSKYAINWVKDKEVRTNHPKSPDNATLFDMLDRALQWLKTNTYQNKILKWETRAWGENPADFGRK